MDMNPMWLERWLTQEEMREIFFKRCKFQIGDKLEVNKDIPLDNWTIVNGSSYTFKDIKINYGVPYSILVGWMDRNGIPQKDIFTYILEDEYGNAFECLRNDIEQFKYEPIPFKIFSLLFSLFGIVGLIAVLIYSILSLDSHWDKTVGNIAFTSIVSVLIGDIIDWFGNIKNRKERRKYMK